MQFGLAAKGAKKNKKANLSVGLFAEPEGA